MTGRLALLWSVCATMLAAVDGDSGTLTASDAAQAVYAAASSVNIGSLVIAVTDRQGNVLAVARQPQTTPFATGNFGQQVDAAELAVGLARTASFFSNNQAPLSSRTVRFISGVHFPPGIAYTAAAPLYGIENTNRGCSLNAAFNPGVSLPPATLLDGVSPGLGPITGKADVADTDANAVNPGGVPLYKNGVLAGGIGVTGGSAAVTEYAAFSGAVGPGFGPTPAAPGVVVIGGIALPFVTQTTRPAGVSTGSPNVEFVVGPLDSPGPAPEGYLIGPAPGQAGGLTTAEVDAIVQNGIAEGNRTRAVIRLPPGSRARFVISVADLDGSILALYRMPDATVFSVDVAAAKARNVIYFSSTYRDPLDLAGVPVGAAVTNRTISFGAQPFYPSGINFTPPGPFFDLFQLDLQHPCTQGREPANANQNGVVFFPGSAPLFRNEQLVGGLGVSGDGVDQDDFVSAAAAAGFLAPDHVRADQIVLRGQRLPYWKFPRNPEQ